MLPFDFLMTRGKTGRGRINGKVHIDTSVILCLSSGINCDSHSGQNFEVSTIGFE